jgi:hypothetical protein
MNLTVETNNSKLYFKSKIYGKKSTNLDKLNILKTILVGFCFLIYTHDLNAKNYPNLGVRFIYGDKTPIYNIKNLETPISTIAPQTGIIPCVFITDKGDPLTGSKGEVLMGIQRKVFSVENPKIQPDVDFIKLIAIYNKIGTERQKQMDILNEITSKTENLVSSMNCDSSVTEVIPLSALSPNKKNLLKLSPPPNDLPESIKSLNELSNLTKPKTSSCKPDKSESCSPQGLLREFHNSPECLSAELQFGNRKEAFLTAWKNFIKKKPPILLMPQTLQV